MNQPFNTKVAFFFLPGNICVVKTKQNKNENPSGERRTLKLKEFLISELQVHGNCVGERAWAAQVILHIPQTHSPPQLHS